MSVWIERLCSASARGYRERVSVDEPLATVTTVGLGGSGAGGGDWYFRSDDRQETEPMEATTKPPYRVPSMAEIAATPANGFCVASTFSGAGGSSLGYKLAGFRVVWANEFVPAAQDVYKLNHAGTFLDTRDIRRVFADDVLKTIGLAPGELDLLDGSPPCASFSMAGKRNAHWSKVKKYSDTKQRTDDLFFEFVRLLRGIKPKTFVAENVSGLVRGVAKGYFKDILRELKSAGYRVESRLLDAQWLGVPQSRQRLIFVGVRDDLGLAPVFPKPLGYRYSVRDALPWINSVSCLLAGKIKGAKSADEPCPAVTTIDTGGNSTHQVTAHIVQESGASHSDRRGERRSIDEPCPTVMARAGRRSGGTDQFQVEYSPVEPEADISRFAIGKQYDATKVGENSERYFNLARPSPDEPCPTITQTGGVSSAAAVVHPFEKRKFSIAELKRICAFPDDFCLSGSYAQQWERLGRAVPPLMMYAIAAAVRDGVLAKIGAKP